MILVTGAAGRLGRRVVQLFLDRGYEVLGTDRVPYEESALSFVVADSQGYEAFLLAQQTTRFDEPTKELIERHFGKGEIPIRGQLQGNSSVIITKKAQRYWA
jgi:NAD(P)-dependent dehydrogenase (short-subunit alcohol dehydrogenase family)